jgi:hypothetical protein
MTKRALAGVSALALGVGFAAFSSVAANATTSTWSFKVDTITTANGSAVDTSSSAGDDGGFLATTSSVLLRQGDENVSSYNLTTLADIANTTANVDGVLFSDFATNKAYSMDIQNTGGDDFFDSAWELDANGDPTTTKVTFSESIPEANGDDWYMGSGAGQVGFWNGTTGELWLVSIPSGTVTKVTVSVPSDYDFGVADNNESDSDIIQAGVLNYDCVSGKYGYVGTDENSDISVWDLSGTDRTMLLENVDSQSDSDTITVSPANGKWYNHTENDGGDNDWTSFYGFDITGMQEPLIQADATFTSSEACPAALPDTGVDSMQAGLMAVGASVLALAGVAFVVIRRRANA